MKFTCILARVPPRGCWPDRRGCAGVTSRPGVCTDRAPGAQGGARVEPVGGHQHRAGHLRHLHHAGHRPQRPHGDQSRVLLPLLHLGGAWQRKTQLRQRVAESDELQELLDECGGGYGKGVMQLIDEDGSGFLDKLEFAKFVTDFWGVDDEEKVQELLATLKATAMAKQDNLKQ
eukprot:9486329-Pyramimonas_sp.AAC.3